MRRAAVTPSLRAAFSPGEKRRDLFIAPSMREAKGERIKKTAKPMRIGAKTSSTHLIARHTSPRWFIAA